MLGARHGTDAFLSCNIDSTFSKGQLCGQLDFSSAFGTQTPRNEDVKTKAVVSKRTNQAVEVTPHHMDWFCWGMNRVEGVCEGRSSALLIPFIAKTV